MTSATTFDLPPHFWRIIRDRLYGRGGSAVERSLHLEWDRERFLAACRAIAQEYNPRNSDNRQTEAQELA